MVHIEPSSESSYHQTNLGLSCLLSASPGFACGTLHAVSMASLHRLSVLWRRRGWLCAGRPNAHTRQGMTMTEDDEEGDDEEILTKEELPHYIAT